MQTIRGALQGRPTSSHYQVIGGHQVHGSAPASKPSRKLGHRLLGWAMSALGIRKRVLQVAEAVVTAPSTSSPNASAEAEPGARAGTETPGRLRVAIVGDVHGSWRGDREAAALRLLAPHLTLLVGDFGNEDVELVGRVAALPLRKAVILGNHDAWFTMTGRAASQARRGAVQQTLSAADMLAARARGGGAAAAATAATPGGQQNCVRQQLALLGDNHVGYGTMPLDEQGYTVVGARPFSKGGKNFSSIRDFMDDLYGVKSMEESAERIVQVAQSAPAHHTLIVVGHNGPAGLGSRHFDICGVDWESGAGDHGDPDLQAALATLHRAGRRVALVTFGHMHHTLHAANSKGRASRLRRMVALDPATGTVFLNAATVPRVTPAPTTPVTVAAAGRSAPPAVPPPSRCAPPPTSPKRYGSGRRARRAAKAAVAAAAVAAAAAAAPSAHSDGFEPATLHHFMVAELEGGEVVAARDVWVQVTPVTEDTAAAVLEAASAAVEERTGGEVESGDEAGAERTSDGSAAAVEAGPRQIDDFVVQVVRDRVVLCTVAGANGGIVKFVWNAQDEMYEPHVFNREEAAPRRADDCGGGEEVLVAAAPGDGPELSAAAPVAAGEPMAAAVTSGLAR